MSGVIVLNYNGLREERPINYENHDAFNRKLRLLVSAFAHKIVTEEWQQCGLIPDRLEDDPSSLHGMYDNSHRVIHEYDREVDCIADLITYQLKSATATKER